MVVFVCKEFYKFPESPFQEKISTTAFKLDNLVKSVVFCYPRDVVGEFPLVSNRIKLRAQMECNNNNNNNNNNDNNNTHFR